MIGILVVILVGTGVIDRSASRAAPPRSPGDSALGVLRVAPSHGTESSAWYCAGGTGAQGGSPTTIVMTNSTSRPVSGTLTAVTAPAAGAPSPAPWADAHAVHVTVPPDAEVSVGAAELQASTSLVAESVVLDGGGVAVAEAVQSTVGWSMAPCSASTAPDWYFAHGATVQGGGLILSLFNPGATDAAVNVTLVSSTAGFLAPSAYQGIDVPPGSLVTENLGDHAPDDAAFATEVSSLSGAIVAAELEAVGTPGNGGLAVTLGSPAPAPTWVFAQNTDVAGEAVSFHVLNPTTRPAVVSVAIELPQGAAAEPLTMTVPPQSLGTLGAESETRIPTGVPYAAVFSSTATGIVVSRQITLPAGPPAPTSEKGDVPGVPGGSTRWLVPPVVSPGTGALSFALVDLGKRPTSVRILTPSGKPVPGQGARSVRPGTPLVIASPGAPFGSAPFEVRADQPVAIELDASAAAGPGVVVVPALASG
jgi:hypothetical protein